jgi:hypothetical protein
VLVVWPLWRHAHTTGSGALCNLVHLSLAFSPITTPEFAHKTHRICAFSRSAALDTEGGMEIVSCGEDGSVLVWSGGELLQSLPHPCCVWAVKALPGTGAFRYCAICVSGVRVAIICCCNSGASSGYGFVFARYQALCTRACWFFRDQRSCALRSPFIQAETS